MSVKLVYETHSTTLDNEAGICTGWLPGDLSAAGERNARDLGERRRDDNVDVVLCSDLRRAVQTAEIAFAGTGIPIHLEARLRECDYGELNGMSRARMELERAARVEVPFPGGESWRQTVARTADLLEELKQRWDGRRVVLIGHSATRYALRVLLEGAELEKVVSAPFGWQEGWEYEV